MPGYNSGGSMCTTPERFYQIQKEAAARHAAAREEEAGEQFAKVMAVLQEMGKDTDFISVMRESFINESKRRHSGGGGSGGGGGVGYDDGEHKCHTLNDPGEVWELASDAVAPTAVVEHVLGKRARHVRSEYEEEGEEDEESEGEENEGEEGEGEKGEGEEGEGEEGPVAGGAAPADQSVAGDVQILISEIGLDPKVLAQYGSLLGQLTHRQQKRRVIAQGGQFGYGGKGSAAGWQLRRLVNSFLEQLGIGSSEQRMFSVAYTEGVGAQSEHQDEEERHCRTRSCCSIKPIGLHTHTNGAHRGAPVAASASPKTASRVSWASGGGAACSPSTTCAGMARSTSSASQRVCSASCRSLRLVSSA